MDVLLYLIILRIVVSLVIEDLINAETCDTSPPNKGKCNGKTLTVVKGKACYYGHHNSHASISCNKMYSFDVGTSFQCKDKKKGWEPSATATCSLIAPPEITSTLTASFTSTFMSSDDIMFTTAISSEPSSLMSSTEKNADFSSYYQPTPSSISPSISPTSASGHSQVSPSMTATLVVSSPAVAAQNADDSGIIAAYIIVPMAILLIALVLGFLLWRRKQHGPSASIKKQGEPGALVRSEANAVNDRDGYCSLVNVRQSRVDDHAEISLDRINSDKNIEDNYQTIDNLPEDNVNIKKSYADFKPSDTKFIDANYSHTSVNKTQKDINLDKTYSHIPLVDASHKLDLRPKNSADDTYNMLNTTSSRIDRDNLVSKTDTEYNHARSGIKYPQIEIDNYSHLASGAPTPGASTNMTSKSEDRHINNKNNIDVDSQSTVTQKSDFNKSPAINSSYETDDATKHNYFILEADTATNAKSFHVVEDETEEQSDGICSHEYFTLEKTNT